jgi:hypothetical protein
MPRMRFEIMIPVFERPKTVRALDRAAIGTGFHQLSGYVKHDLAFVRMHFCRFEVVCISVRMTITPVESRTGDVLNMSLYSCLYTTRSAGKYTYCTEF